MKFIKIRQFKKAILGMNNPILYLTGKIPKYLMEGNKSKKEKNNKTSKLSLFLSIYYKYTYYNQLARRGPSDFFNFKTH